MIEWIRRWKSRRLWTRLDKAFDDADWATARKLAAKLVATGDTGICAQVLPPLAGMQISIGDGDGAEASLERLRVIHAQFASQFSKQEVCVYHELRAGLYRLQRKFGAAVLAAERAVQLSDEPRLRMELAWMLKMDGQVDKSIDILTALVSDQPKDDVCRLSLIGYLHLAGRHDEAQQHDSMVESSDDSTYLMNKAWIGACKDDLDECLRFIEASAATDDPDGLLGFYNMDVEFDRFRENERFKKALCDVSQSRRRAQ